MLRHGRVREVLLRPFQLACQTLVLLILFHSAHDGRQSRHSVRLDRSRVRFPFFQLPRRQVDRGRGLDIRLLRGHATGGVPSVWGPVAWICGQSVGHDPVDGADVLGSENGPRLLWLVVLGFPAPEESFELTDQALFARRLRLADFVMQMPQVAGILSKRISGIMDGNGLNMSSWHAVTSRGGSVGRGGDNRRRLLQRRVESVFRKRGRRVRLCGRHDGGDFQS